jgi:hypothetical protein
VVHSDFTVRLGHDDLAVCDAFRRFGLTPIYDDVDATIWVRMTHHEPSDGLVSVFELTEAAEVPCVTGRDLYGTIARRQRQAAVLGGASRVVVPTYSPPAEHGSPPGSGTEAPAREQGLAEEEEE